MNQPANFGMRKNVCPKTILVEQKVQCSSVLSVESRLQRLKVRKKLPLLTLHLFLWECGVQEGKILKSKFHARNNNMKNRNRCGLWIPQRGFRLCRPNTNEPNNAIMGNDIAHHDTSGVFRSVSAFWGLNDCDMCPRAHYRSLLFSPPSLPFAPKRRKINFWLQLQNTGEFHVKNKCDHLYMIAINFIK